MIVTHSSLDLDAIVGVWLLKRFSGLGIEGHEVVFVNTNNSDPDMLKLAIAVVDTGKAYDPSRLRFDHHQLPGDESTETCAALQVYTYLSFKLGAPVDHLEPLIDLVCAGDTGQKTNGADVSRELGLHALLSGYKDSFIEATGKPAPDREVLSWAFGLLDLLDIQLKNRAKAKIELAEKVVYRSGDGKLVAIRHGSQGSTFAAQEDGAVLVVFEGEPIMDGETALSYPVGVIRAGERAEPHVGKLVEKVIEACEYELASGGQPGDYRVEASLLAELSQWFKHGGGFYSGRGTGKAMDPRPVEASLVDIARAVDKAWLR